MNESLKWGILSLFFSALITWFFTDLYYKKTLEEERENKKISERNFNSMSSQLDSAKSQCKIIQDSLNVMNKKMIEILIKTAPQYIEVIDNKDTKGIIFNPRTNNMKPIVEKILIDEITHYGMGIGHLYYGDYDRAIQSFNDANEIKPGHGYAKAYNGMGIAYRLCENYNKAVDAYKVAIKLDTIYAEAYYNLGIVFQFMNNQKEADYYFAKAKAIENKTTK